MTQKAKIGFVIYYPFQYYVYKNVYKQLEDSAEFIIDLGPFYPNPQHEAVLPAIIELLEKEKVPYRILSYKEYTSDMLELFLTPYEVLVSVWLRGCINSRVAYQKKRVHMTYGAGKELTAFDLRKRNFDLILAYGEYDHAFYSQITHSEVIGNPKFDDWFADSIDMSSITHVSQRLDPKKKTVLYLPTHSDLSSIDELADQMKALTHQYNVVAKLHYYTPREQPEHVAALSDSALIVLTDETDLLPLLTIADVVVSDNSSAIFDAILADKPIIATDFHEKEYFNTEHTRFRYYRRGQAGPLTYTGSIEQRIKREGSIDSIQSSDQLPSTIARVLLHDEKVQKRAKLKEMLFSMRDASAGKRGAQAIRTLMAQREISEKPFLYYAAGLYAANVLRNAGLKPRWVDRLRYYRARIRAFLGYAHTLLGQIWNLKV